MGRKIKIGLDYFPMDVDFFDDIKVRKLIKHKGSVSILVYSYLLSLIYKDGYFLKWDEDLPFIIYEKIGQDESYIKDVINYLIDIEMFSKDMFEKENILTSKGIQKRYQKICDTLKRSNCVDVYDLINTEEIQINTEETAIDSEEINENDIETDINSGESATKEGKGKEWNGREKNINKEDETFLKFETKDTLPRLYKDLIPECKTETTWIESMCMNLGIFKEKVFKYFDDFEKKQAAEGCSSATKKEFKKHFFNYIKKMESINAEDLSILKPIRR